MLKPISTFSDSEVSEFVENILDGDTLEHPMVGEVTHYTDAEGITHIHILDENIKYVKIGEEWIATI